MKRLQRNFCDDKTAAGYVACRMWYRALSRAFRRADFSVYRLELWASSSVAPARVCEFPGKQESSGNSWPALRRARSRRETAGQEGSAGRKAFFRTFWADERGNQSATLARPVKCYLFRLICYVSWAHGLQRVLESVAECRKIPICRPVFANPSVHVTRLTTTARSTFPELSRLET